MAEPARSDTANIAAEAAPARPQTRRVFIDPLPRLASQPIRLIRSKQRACAAGARRRPDRIDGNVSMSLLGKEERPPAGSADAAVQSSQRPGQEKMHRAQPLRD